MEDEVGQLAEAQLAQGKPVKAKKARAPKKEKKPVQVVAVVTPNGIEGNFIPEPRRPLIVHLPFSSGDVKFSDALHYDPNPPPEPQPYDEEQGAYFKVEPIASQQQQGQGQWVENGQTGEENQIGIEKEGWNIDEGKVLLAADGNGSGAAGEKEISVGAGGSAAAVPTASTASGSSPVTAPVEGFHRLLTQYATKKGETFTPPETTDVACFWCCGGFEGAPCFIPVKEEDGIFHVYGNYCSPSCAMSFLLQEHMDSHVRWERMSLLHRLYKPNTHQGRIYPAPPRESLKQYGGVYTLEQFRNIIQNHKMHVDIQHPPMISILGILDTKPIDFYDSSMQTSTGGFSMDRFKSWSEQGGALRLKRSKPLKDPQNTLAACMQFGVKKGDGAT